MNRTKEKQGQMEFQLMLYIQSSIITKEGHNEIRRGYQKEYSLENHYI